MRRPPQRLKAAESTSNWLPSSGPSVLKPGGRVYVQTHFAFPLHAYPHDYWRFSREALETLFAEEHGFGKRTSFYQFPCSILSEQDPVGIGLKSYLNVGIVAEKGTR